MEISKSNITVDNVSKSIKGLMQAQLRQVVTIKYPKQKAANNMKATLYSNAQLGIESTDYTDTRIAWMSVPEDATPESVAKDLAAVPSAQLVRYLASNIILDDDQKQVYQNGLRGSALDSFNEKYEIAAGTPWGEQHTKLFLQNVAERQVVRYGENNTDGKPADEIVPFNGKPQYRRALLDLTGELQDVDYRVKADVVAIEDIDIAPKTEAVAETAKAEKVA